jgi:hypothetical protein
VAYQRDKHQIGKWMGGWMSEWMARRIWECWQHVETDGRENNLGREGRTKQEGRKGGSDAKEGRNAFFCWKMKRKLRMS